MFAWVLDFLLSLKRLLYKVAGAVVQIRKASEVKRWWGRVGEEKLER